MYVCVRTAFGQTPAAKQSGAAPALAAQTRGGSERTQEQGELDLWQRLSQEGDNPRNHSNEREGQSDNGSECIV